MTYRATFLQALKEIRFEPNDPAYLALTSKLELQVRDKSQMEFFDRTFQEQILRIPAYSDLRTKGANSC